MLDALKDVKEDLLKLAAFLMTTRRKDLQDVAKNAWQKATVAIAKAELVVKS